MPALRRDYVKMRHYKTDEANDNNSVDKKSFNVPVRFCREKVSKMAEDRKKTGKVNQNKDVSVDNDQLGENKYEAFRPAGEKAEKAVKNTLR